jgi:hypothetical protein
MSNKGFILMLTGALVLGGVLGGSFFGGVALGKSQGDDDTPSTAQVVQPPGAQSQTQPVQESGLQTLADLRQRVQSGKASQEELTELRQQLQEQFGQGGAGQAPGGLGFSGGSGVTGVIEKIEDGTVTITTQQGPLQATLGPDTRIQITALAEIGDLAEGMRLTVTGERAEDGTLEAATVFVVPEGAQGFGGGGLRGGFGGGGFGGGGGGRPGQQ